MQAQRYLPFEYILAMSDAAPADEGSCHDFKMNSLCKSWKCSSLSSSLYTFKFWMLSRILAKDSF